MDVSVLLADYRAKHHGNLLVTDTSWILLAEKSQELLAMTYLMFNHLDHCRDHSLGIHMLCWCWDSSAWHNSGRLPHNRFCFEICLHNSSQELARVMLSGN